MLKQFIRLYSPGFSLAAVAKAEASATAQGYFKWLLAGAPAGYDPVGLTPLQTFVAAVLTFGGYLQVLLGIGLIVGELSGGYVGGVAFGAALIVALPFSIAVFAPLLLALAHALAQSFRPKAFIKNLLCAILESQVKALRQRHAFTVIAVVGSVGKTSTKLAVAELFTKTGLRVRYQTGNYNDRLTVPLVVFDRSLPRLMNVFAWAYIVLANAVAVRRAYTYDVVVLELGTDGPGQIAAFAYLQPELTILTAITPEHMEYFGSLDAVAEEELAAVAYSDHLLINTSSVPKKYLPSVPFTSYSSAAQSKYGYSSKSTERGLEGQVLTVFCEGKSIGKTTIVYLGVHGAGIVLAAIASADIFGVARPAILRAAEDLQPFAGRMQLLQGIKDTTIIDDTYNAAPDAVQAALKTLVQTPGPQHIAVLGSMNELGQFSPAAHTEIGESFKDTSVDLLVTIGHDARQYLAPAAEAAGQTVVSFDNPHKAGLYVTSKVVEGAVVLVKGSQNGVFAEEAIKPLLKDQADTQKLVRQTPGWMRQKLKQFKLP